MYGRISDLGIAPDPPRVELALRTQGWGSTPCGAVSTRGTTMFSSRFVVVIDVWEGYPGMVPDPPLVALGHSGSMAGINPLPYQPSRRSQQPLA